MKSEWISVRIDGIVQGVGFRPAVYRAASRLGLAGFVENAVDGVHILVRASDREISKLFEAIRRELPPVARIDSVDAAPATPPSPAPEDFSIRESDRHGGRPTDVSPDIAICDACLEDMRRQPRRKDYPLTNCTNCGPRFTIIRRLPYDRPATAMREFGMCPDCRREYTSPLDRRFHAQPVACRFCGPQYSMYLPERNCMIDSYPLILEGCAGIIRHGGIVMVKSMGGYNLMADARNESAVGRLREIKSRPRKPFALMVRNPEEARIIASLHPREEEALASWRTPVVIVNRRPDYRLPENVAPGCSTIGLMLPYMGFQHGLMDRIQGPVAVTSANLPGCPIMTDDSEAKAYAASFGLPLVSFNRDIVNRVDDSVVRLCGGDIRILRRSRGYAPEPLRNQGEVDGIIGIGADVTSQWGFGRGNDIIQSQYIGSLTSEGGERFLRESIKSMSEIFSIRPRKIVVDAHPGYRSSAVGREIAAKTGSEVIAMWHHHAHAVSVMAEYGLHEPVMALVLDGTGLGPDRTIWGSELMVCDRTRFRRLSHGPMLPMPGGDSAAREPWRMAVSIVMTFCGADREHILSLLPSRFIEAVGTGNIIRLAEIIEKRINCPLSCGAGRLWDGVAAILGLSYRNGYEAEAPVLLENAAMRAPEKEPEKDWFKNGRRPLVNIYDGGIADMMRGIIADARSGFPPAEIAMAFHRSYAADWIKEIRRNRSSNRIGKIVLSGGVFQNRILADLIRRGLENIGMEVFIPVNVPCGDGGIAVGQIAHAAAIV